MILILGCTLISGLIQPEHKITTLFTLISGLALMGYVYKELSGRRQNE